MRVIKHSIIILITCIMLFNINALAIEDINLETVDKKECDLFVAELVTSVINNDISFLNANGYAFTSNCYDRLAEFTETNRIKGNDVSISMVEVTYPSNSSSGDTVIMANTKVIYKNPDYTKLYLFEFHVNSSGDVYGYNVWVY